MPSRFYNARLTEFTAQVRMWPVVITANGATATCIMTPEKERMTMMGNNYQKTIEVTVDILRADWETLGLAPTVQTPRPRFTTASGVVYEQQSHNDDENEPTVQLVARRVQ